MLLKQKWLCKAPIVIPNQPLRLQAMALLKNNFNC